MVEEKFWSIGLANFCGINIPTWFISSYHCDATNVDVEMGREVYSQFFQSSTRQLQHSTPYV